MRLTRNRFKFALLASALSSSLMLAGCGNMLDRVSRLGDTPEMNDIQNPTAQANYKPVSLPMPAPSSDLRQPAALSSRISAPPASATF
jgi:flagellar L-ring protein precursor FlgH